jgi:hypothetical protein
MALMTPMAQMPQTARRHHRRSHEGAAARRSVFFAVLHHVQPNDHGLIYLSLTSSYAPTTTVGFV